MQELKATRKRTTWQSRHQFKLRMEKEEIARATLSKLSMKDDTGLKTTVTSLGWSNWKRRAEVDIFPKWFSLRYPQPVCVGTEGGGHLWVEIDVISDYCMSMGVTTTVVSHILIQSSTAVVLQITQYKNGSLTCWVEEDFLKMFACKVLIMLYVMSSDHR